MNVDDLMEDEDEDGEAHGRLRISRGDAPGNKFMLVENNWPSILSCLIDILLYEEFSKAGNIYIFYMNSIRKRHFIFFQTNVNSMNFQAHQERMSTMK